MDKTVGKPETIDCAFCHQPLTRIYLGENFYPIYAHMGDTIKKCHMLKIDANPVQLMLERVNKLGKNPGVEINKYGRPKLHNEP